MQAHEHVGTKLRCGVFALLVLKNFKNYNMYTTLHQYQGAEKFQHGFCARWAKKHTKKL